jgi:hypothetical protein
MFKVGDLVRLKRGYDTQFKASAGATATITEISVFKNIYGWYGSPTREYVRIEWVRDGKDNGQSNGLYYPEDFAKVYPTMDRYKRRKAL